MAIQTQSAPAIAQSIGTCTRAFGDWVQQRDTQLKRMEAEPTLLGLGNTYCTSSLARIGDLRSGLEAVRAACTQVAGEERLRVDRLIVRAGLQLDNVKFCAAQVTVAEAEPEAWETSVRAGPKTAPKPEPGKPAVEKPAPIKGEAQVTAANEPVAPFKTTVSAREPEPKAIKQDAPKAPAAKVAAKEVKPAAVPKPQEPMPVAVAFGGNARPAHTVGAQMVAATPVAQSKPATAEDSFDGLKRYSVQAEAQPKAANGNSAEDEDCLVVTKTSAASYLIENKNCRPQVVLAAIELSRPGHTMRCFTKKVSDGIAIAGESGSPSINFQCREGAKGCQEGMLRGMFPECQPG